VNVLPDLIYDNNEPVDPSPLRHQEKVAETKAPGCYVCFMKRDEATSRLQQHEADLKRLGVEHLYMFGSTARGEANDDSDVDLVFDYEKGKLGLFELMDVKEYVNARARQPPL